jgi:tetratricopeptide (TPR) repeat protein
MQLQDEITGRLTRRLDLALTNAESHRAQAERPNDPDAVDLTMQADAAVTRVLKVFPNNALAHFVKGEILRGGGKNFESAIGEYQAAISIDPSLAPAYALLGNAKILGIPDAGQVPCNHFLPRSWCSEAAISAIMTSGNQLNAHIQKAGVRLPGWTVMIR